MSFFRVFFEVAPTGVTSATNTSLPRILSRIKLARFALAVVIERNLTLGLLDGQILLELVNGKF